MGYYLAAFCLSDLLSVLETGLYIRKMSFQVLGQSSRVCYKAFAQQRVTVLNKSHANIINTLLRTFIGIEKVVTKQMLQYLVALSFLKTPLAKIHRCSCPSTAFVMFIEYLAWQQLETLAGPGTRGTNGL